MGARPGTGFPACPGTGPAKRAPAVGRGRSLAPSSLLFPNPRAGRNRAFFPKDNQGAAVPGSLSGTCPPGKGPSSLEPTKRGKRPAARYRGGPGTTWLLTPALCCPVVLSVLGRKRWFTSLTSRGSDLIGLGWNQHFRNRQENVFNLKKDSKLQKK